MGNLVEELGTNYVSQYFQGAMLRDEGEIYQFVGMRDSATALVEKFLREGNDGPRGGWEEIIIPVSKLKNFASFSSPVLGYRNIFHEGKIVSVLHLTSQRSTRRGFRTDNVRAENLEVFNMPVFDEGHHWDFFDRWKRTKIIYSPEFLGLKKGLAELRAGNLIGFAVNRDIAVAIDIDIEAKFPWSIYFRGMRVGGINDSGVITVHNKIVNRQDVRSQLEILE